MSLKRQTIGNHLLLKNTYKIHKQGIIAPRIKKLAIHRSLAFVKRMVDLPNPGTKRQTCWSQTHSINMKMRKRKTQKLRRVTFPIDCS